MVPQTCLHFIQENKCTDDINDLIIETSPNGHMHSSNLNLNENSIQYTSSHYMTSPHSLGSFASRSPQVLNHRNQTEFVHSVYDTNKSNSPMSPELQRNNNNTVNESNIKSSSWFVKIDSKDEVEEDDEDEDILGIRYGIFWLLIVTIFISILSDMLVETI